MRTEDAMRVPAVSVTPRTCLAPLFSACACNLYMKFKRSAWRSVGTEFVCC